MYQSFHRSREVGGDTVAARASSRRSIFGVGSALALAVVLLHSACSSEGRPPAPNGAGAGPSAGEATDGSNDEDDGLGGSSGAAGASGDSGGSAGSGLAGSGMGGGTPLREDCTPSEACQTYCSALGPDPTCGVGNAAQCACFCEERLNDPCPRELAAMLACISDKSATADCPARKRLIEGCEQEAIALELCDLSGLEQLCAGNTPVCDTYCRANVRSFCPEASESVSECLCGCEANVAGRCETELQAFITCASDDPSFSCGSAGELVPQTCTSEWQTFRTCLLPAADAGP
jgi:hypothetical protein